MLLALFYIALANRPFVAGDSPETLARWKDRDGPEKSFRSRGHRNPEL